MLIACCSSFRRHRICLAVWISRSFLYFLKKTHPCFLHTCHKRVDSCFSGSLYQSEAQLKQFCESLVLSFSGVLIHRRMNFYFKCVVELLKFCYLDMNFWIFVCLFLWCEFICFGICSHGKTKDCWAFLVYYAISHAIWGLKWLTVKGVPRDCSPGLCSLLPLLSLYRITFMLFDK